MTQKSPSEIGQSNASTFTGNGSEKSAPAGQSGSKEGLQKIARDLKGEAAHMASDFAGEAKKAAESKLGAGKDFAAEHLGSVADALRKTSKELRSSQSAATEYVEKAASSVESISDYFQTRTLSQLMGDAEDFARREPAVFLGGAFFVGMLGGRFLKAATPAAAQPSNGNAPHAMQGGGAQKRALPEHKGTRPEARPDQERHATNANRQGNGGNGGSSASDKGAKGSGAS